MDIKLVLRAYGLAFIVLLGLLPSSSKAELGFEFWGSQDSVAIGDSSVLRMRVEIWDRDSPSRSLAVGVKLLNDCDGQFKLLTDRIYTSRLHPSYVVVLFAPVKPLSEALAWLEISTEGGIWTNPVRGDTRELIPGAHFRLYEPQGHSKLRYQSDSLELSRDTIWVQNPWFATDTLNVWVENLSSPFRISEDTIRVPVGMKSPIVLQLDSIDLKLHRDTFAINSNSVGKLTSLTLTAQGQAVARVSLSFDYVFPMEYPSISGEDTQAIMFRSNSPGSKAWVKLGVLEPPFFYIYDTAGATFDLRYGYPRKVVVSFKPEASGDFERTLFYETNAANQANLGPGLVLTGTSLLASVATPDMELGEIVYEPRMRSFRIKSLSPDDKDLRIYNAIGQLVWSAPSSSIRAGRISVESLSPGIYFATIGVRSVRFVVTE